MIRSLFDFFSADQEISFQVEKNTKFSNLLCWKSLYLKGLKDKSSNKCFTGQYDIKLFMNQSMVSIYMVYHSGLLTDRAILLVSAI